MDDRMKLFLSDIKQLALCYEASLKRDRVPKKVRGVTKLINEEVEGLRTDAVAHIIVCRIQEGILNRRTRNGHHNSN